MSCRGWEESPLRTYQVALEPFLPWDSKLSRIVTPVTGRHNGSIYEFFMTYDDLMDPMTIAKTRRHTINWQEEFHRCRVELFSKIIPADAHLILCFSNATTLTSSDIMRLTQDRAASPIARDFRGRPISDYLYFHLVLGKRVQWYQYAKARLPGIIGTEQLDDTLVLDAPLRYRELLLKWCQGGVVLPSPDISAVTEWCRTGRENSAELLKDTCLLFWNSREETAVELVTPNDCWSELRSRAGLVNMNLRLERLTRRLI